MLGGLIGREVHFFAQDVVNFAIVGNDWQVNIWADEVYCGDLANFELSGLHVNSECAPNYSPEREPGYWYSTVLGNTRIQDVRIIYHHWQDEWTATNEPFNLRLQGGELIATAKGYLIALLEPYDLAYTYPFSS